MASLSDNKGGTEPFGGANPGDASVLEVVNVKKFLESRCFEIEELISHLKRSDKQDRVFQRLPFVLRRRATSHNPFRVPKKLRLHLAREMVRSMPKCSKRLRKDVRRRLNRLEEYRRRCERNQWLETHLYHAKRFKMATIWGYRIAFRSSQKCRRRCIRACKRRCVIHDLSYVRAVGVTGKLSVLRDAFRLIFSDSAFMFQDRLLSGEYRSTAYAYSCRDAGYHMICPTSFIWIHHGGVESASDATREIWFFVHPSSINEFMDTIKQSSDQLTCYKVKDLCTFEVIGPLSALLLRSVLKLDPSVSTGNSLWKRLNPYDIDIPPCYVLPLSVETPVIYGNRRPDLKLSGMNFQEDRSLSFTLDHVLLAERMHLPNYDLPGNFELLTKVNIPRLRRRNYAHKVSQLLSSLAVTPSGKSMPSDDKVESNIATVLQSNDASSDATSQTPTTESGTKTVPIWLVRRGDSLSGFDVIIPAGTIARRLWVLLNRYGGLGIGLAEREMVYAEYGQCSFPQDYPDTPAGHILWKSSAADSINKYLSTPANKRPNYRYMGNDRPFHLPLLTSAETASCDTNAVDNDRDIHPRAGWKSTSCRSSTSADDPRFLKTLPAEWVPRTFLGRTGGNYLRSKYLLMSCVTAGIHKVYPELEPFQVIRATSLPFTTSNGRLRSLIDGNMDPTSLSSISPGNNMSLSCIVHLPCRGSLHVRDRLYIPSKDDLESCPGFLSAIFRGQLGTCLSRWITSPNVKGASTNHGPNLSKTVSRDIRLLEPGHEEYKLSNLKQLFGCNGKCKRVNPIDAMHGMNELETRWHPNIRRCFGSVTSVGYTRKGICIIQLPGFLELLRMTLTVCGLVLPPNIPLDQIHLFVWVRSIHSRVYIPGIISLAVSDGLASTG